MGVLPPFESRSDAATQLAREFPEHGDQIRLGTKALSEISDELLAKRAEYRRLGLEIAGLEAALKRKIGLFHGLKVKGGTWFWEKANPKKRIQWVTLARMLGITKRMIRAFEVEAPPTRLLRFQREKPPE